MHYANILYNKVCNNICFECTLYTVQYTVDQYVLALYTDQCVSICRTEQYEAVGHIQLCTYAIIVQFV